MFPLSSERDKELVATNAITRLGEMP